MIAEGIFVLVFILGALNARKEITGFLLAIGLSFIFEISVLLLLFIYVFFMFFDKIELPRGMSAIN